MIKCHFVDVKSISSKLPRSSFDEAEIEVLADAILATNGLLRPLILERTGAETYQVIAGDREYYAAVRAKEKDIKKAEMVNAFVIEPIDRAAALAQLDLLAPSQTTPDIDPLLAAISQIIAQQLQPVLTQLDRHELLLSKLDRTPQTVDPISDPPTEKVNPEPVPPPAGTEHKQPTEPKSSKTRSTKKTTAESKPNTDSNATDRSTVSKTTKTKTDRQTAAKASEDRSLETTIATTKTNKTRTTTSKSTKTKSPATKQVKPVEIVAQTEPEQPKPTVNPLAAVDPLKAVKTLDLIDRLDEDMLMRRMKQSGIPKAEQLVPKIIAQRELQPRGKFDSWEQIAAAKISGLGEATIIKIIDKLK
jgi:ParB-like chromosome segregation protein Spo0J